MQDFKQRRATSRKPWLKRRFRLGLRRGKSALPKGFRPLPAPPSARRESNWKVPRVRLLRPPLAALQAAILLWLAVGVAWNGWALLTGPLAKVQLSGNHKLKGAEVLAAAGIAPGLTMDELDPIAVTRRLAVHPHVAAVDVRRVYPGNLWIDLRERSPSLRVQAGDRMAVLDDNNVVIEAGAPPPDAAGLPLVRGLGALPSPGERVRDPALQRAREFLAVSQEQGLGPDQVREIDAERAFMLAVRFSEGRRALFSTGHVAAELRIWRNLAASPAADGPLTIATGGTVDLRAAAQEDGRIALHP